MKEFNYKKIDAFATLNSVGNPAGYVLLNENETITEPEMLQIAREQKGFVNEVGFVRRINTELLELKYYSAEREVDFCGHATIAILYDILKHQTELTDHKTRSIQTKRGLLTVYNHIADQDAVYIMSPVPTYRTDTPNAEDICWHLGIIPSDINTNWPISIINAGLTTLIVPIIGLKAILDINPDITGLKNFCVENKIDIIEVFCTEVSSTKSDYRTRVFAPTFGYLEDPATGSGNSAFGYYLLKFGKWTKESLTIEQNNEPEKFNVVKLQKTIDNEKQERVLFGGSAITRIEGKYFIY
jgi:PhzF family phenazine biosynthesis protein